MLIDTEVPRIGGISIFPYVLFYEIIWFMGLTESVLIKVWDPTEDFEKKFNNYFEKKCDGIEGSITGSSRCCLNWL